MVDREVFDRRLAGLEQLLRDLRGLARSGRAQFLRDRGLQARAERWLQLAAESVLDLANHLISERGWRTPDSYRDSIRVLAEEGVLGEQLASRIEAWAGLRIGTSSASSVSPTSLAASSNPDAQARATPWWSAARRDREPASVHQRATGAGCASLISVFPAAGSAPRALPSKLPRLPGAVEPMRAGDHSKRNQESGRDPDHTVTGRAPLAGGDGSPFVSTPPALHAEPTRSRCRSGRRPLRASSGRCDRCC